MTFTVRRIVLSCFTLGVAVTGLVIPASAHAQYSTQRPTQQRIAEGTHQWSTDGWCYVVQGGRWVRTSYFRRFPDPRNYPTMFDIYQNGQFLRRVGAPTVVGNQVQAGNAQLRAAEIQLQQLVTLMQQQTAQQRAQAARGTGPLYAGTVGGGSPAVYSNGPLYAGTVGGDSDRYITPGLTVTMQPTSRALQEIQIQSGQTSMPPFLANGTVIIRR